MLILGDNPFFGVNHASVAKSKAYLEKLRSRDWSSAKATMRAALANDVSTFMVSTHAEAPELLGSMAEDAELRRFSIVPAVPYLHRLNALVAARGVAAALARSVSYPMLARSLLRGLALPSAVLHAFVTKEIEPISRLGFAVPAIALQNIFVDLLLGLGVADLINQLAEPMRREGRKLIAITMNPVLADKLLSPDIVICTHYNYIGYMVQPDLAQMQKWLATTGREVWAMGVFASGRARLPAVVADPSLRSFRAVVVGASRPDSIVAFATAYAPQH